MNYKLENVTNLTTARWAAAEGFSYISFNFDREKSSYIQPMQVVEICKWITGPFYVGSFGNQEPEVIKDIFDLLPIDYIELNLETAKKFLPVLEIPCILRVNKNDWKECIEFQKTNQNIFAFSFNNPDEITSDFPIEFCFLPEDFIINPNHNKQPFGINFNSENEIEPGVVDFEKMESALEKWANML